MSETNLSEPGQPQKSPPAQSFTKQTAAGGDIPEALRDLPIAPSLRRRSLRWVGIGALAVGAFLLALLLSQVRFAASSTALLPMNSLGESVMTSVQQILGSEDDRLLGHVRYEEAPAEELQPITADGSFKLRKAAAEKFQQMTDAAAAEGVILVPLSGFRSIADQERVFFDVQAERAQAVTTRSEVSAPPGYSEHHTGYAVDIGDGVQAAADLQFDFDTTPAFKWLQENAARYGFELSFPKDNAQGVSYEPWHWRFVGDRHSLETFYRARTLNTVNPNGDQE